MNAKVQKILKYRIAVTIFFYVLLAARLYLKYSISNPDEYGILTGLTLLLMFLCWGIILLDMIFSSVRKKFFWIILMVVLSYFAPLFYLLRRKKKEPGSSGKSRKFYSFFDSLKGRGKS